MTHPTCSRGSSGSCRHLCSQPSTSQLLQQCPVRVEVPCMWRGGLWQSCDVKGTMGGWEPLALVVGRKWRRAVVGKLFHLCPSPGVSSCWGRKCVFMYVNMSMYAQAPVRCIMVCVSVRCVSCTHLHRVTEKMKRLGLWELDLLSALTWTGG